MVKLPAALFCEDTRTVRLPSTRINTHRDWLLLDRRHQGICALAHMADTLDATCWDAGLATGRLACTVPAFVWVTGLCADGRIVRLEVVPAVILETTTATFISLVAIQELLLGQGSQLARGHVLGSLKTASGSEGPAAATTALVLDVGDCSLRAPIHVGGSLGTIPLVNTKDRQASIRW